MNIGTNERTQNPRSPSPPTPTHGDQHQRTSVCATQPNPVQVRHILLLIYKSLFVIYAALIPRDDYLQDNVVM